MKKKISNFLFNLPKFNKKIIILGIDIFFFIISHILTNFLRSEIFYFSYPYYPYVILFSFFSFLIIFNIFNIYNNILRSTNLLSVKQIFYASLIYMVIFYLFLQVFRFHNFPRSIAIIQPLFLLVLVIINRYSIKSIYNFFINTKLNTNVIIYGAGEAGIQSINLISNYKIIKFIYDDFNKQGRRHEKIFITNK